MIRLFSLISASFNSSQSEGCYVCVTLNTDWVTSPLLYKDNTNTDDIYSLC